MSEGRWALARHGLRDAILRGLFDVRLGGSRDCLGFLVGHHPLDRRLGAVVTDEAVGEEAALRIAVLSLGQDPLCVRRELVTGRSDVDLPAELV